MKLIFYCFILLFGLAATGRAQPRVAALPPEGDQSLEFVQNRGQWPAGVRYGAAVPGGHLYLESSALRYVLLQPLPHPHDPSAAAPASARGAGETLRGHQLWVRFEGARASAPLQAAQATTGAHNYLSGNDPARWAPAAAGYRQVSYQQPWPGIDVRLYENATQHLEYDVELAAGADPGRVRLRYEGATSLRMSADGQLHVGTTVGDLTELHPQAYQTDPTSGERQPVACAYRLDPEENIVSFALGTYDHARPLVIDPTVIFSTYSGALGSNWGFTATYDNDGNMYSGGIVLNDGFALPSFPTTGGAFQTTFGGVIDIALIKYNPAVNGAASRVWATYLGGDRADFPSSLVVNAANELIVLGSTASTNYPTTRGAVQRSFKGGTSVQPFGDTGYPYEVTNGTDIVVSRLAANGASLLASTYLGGSANDGIAAYVATSATRQLPQNYGDALRGDVLTDAQGNVYLASVSASTDFPVTAGSFGNAYRGGNSDAVLCKLSPDLSSLTWSGLLGGPAADAAYSLQLDAAGNVYAAGGTLSPSLPGTAGAYQSTNQGGVDGFVARIAANGSAVQRATFVGTAAYDQAFFVQLGADGGVYLLGQTLGAWPVTAGTYRNAGSRQFISKLSPELNALQVSTVFGSGRSTIDISPTAFLVDQCDRVYACGWGGQVNQAAYTYAGYASQNGYTDGLPTTPNAVRTTPDTPGQGSDFYLVQLSAGLGSLVYGTYYGNATPYSTGDHVDGGTSRFDPRGVVYAAVCSCFSGTGFPVPPGAYTYSAINGSKSTNGQPLCNNAAFKINFEPTVATVGSDRTVCTNNGPVALNGTPNGGTWSGPGVSGSVAAGFVFTPAPALVGVQTLTYTLTGVTTACTVTARQVITVAPVQQAALAPLPQDTYCLQAGVVPPTVALQGSPAGGVFSGPGVVGSVFSPAAAGAGIFTITYTVGAATPCPSSATRQVAVLGATAGADFALCSNSGPVALPSGQPAGGTWSGPGVSGSARTGYTFTPDPTLGSVRQTLTYSVPTANGTCEATAQVLVTVSAPPQAVVQPLGAVCATNGPVALSGGSPAGGTWSGPGVSGSVAAGFVFTPAAVLVGVQTLTYTVLAGSVCANLASQATTTIQVQPAFVAVAPPDTVLCPGSTRPFSLRALPAGGTWSGAGVSGSVAAGFVFTPAAAAGVYSLTYQVGTASPCPSQTTRRVTLLAAPTLAPSLVPGTCTPSSVAPLVVHYRQDAATLPAGAVVTWYFGDDSTAVTGFDVTHTYRAAGTFRPRLVVSFNQNRCAQPLGLPPVVVQAMLIPNVFTPNGDGQNDRFAPRLGGCAPRLQVFSRWGQQVYEAAAYQNTWDGAGLAPGIYYYLLTPPDGSPAIKGWVEMVKN
ncbi:MAG: gliding motility-associated C-terminal domain-containing protein [Janthinobacterium lividum]